MVTTRDPREVAPLSAIPEAALLGRRDRLDRMLGPEGWAALRVELGPAIDDEHLRRIPPMLLVEHLARVRMAEAEAEADGRAPVPYAASTSSVIGEVLEWARVQGVEIVTLESPEESEETLAPIPHEVALEALRDALSEPEAWRQRARALRSAHGGADDRALAAACAAALGEGAVAEARRARRAARLEAWSARVAEQIAEGRAFLAIPACDVVGTDGTLARIQASGVRVRRLGAPPGSAPPRDLGRSRAVGVLP